MLAGTRMKQDLISPSPLHTCAVQVSDAASSALLSRGLWQCEAWGKGGLAASASSHLPKVSGGKVRQKCLHLFREMRDGLESRCDSHAFRPHGHLFLQLSLRALQCTQKELSLGYLLMLWAVRQLASSKLGLPPLPSASEPRFRQALQLPERRLYCS